MAYKDGKDPEFEYYQNIYNQANTNSAQKQMDFQKMMSDTSHQRETLDLMKAGLNPALSLNNGASSPAGAYANVDSTSNTARSQQKIAQSQIDAQVKMNKQSLENAYRIAEMQTAMQYKVAELQAMMSYQMGIDVAGIQTRSAYDIASFNQSQENYRQSYGIEHPTTPSGILAQGLRQSFNPSTYANANKITKAQLQSGKTTAEVYYNRAIAGTGSTSPINSAKKQSNISTRFADQKYNPVSKSATNNSWRTSYDGSMYKYKNGKLSAYNVKNIPITNVNYKKTNTNAKAKAKYK